MALHPDFLSKPLAHRGLHDVANGIAENSLAAFARAIRHGYGIELDIQPSRDQNAIVFHDKMLDRLTDKSGAVSALTAAELGQIRLKGGADNIPDLREVLKLVNGCAPLLIEIKDQHGRLGPTSGALEAEIARQLSDYRGPVAVMSFNPNAIAMFSRYAPQVSCGLVTANFAHSAWDFLPSERRAELAKIPDVQRLNANFISHDRGDLASKRVAELKALGVKILCWTVRSKQQEARARNFADNITFESYLA
ncbi:MAG: phosphodiesterase [Alphaproteobacteria bacterium]|nr:phosphodiesterase [Alphaproteobacteria bacterium]